MASLEPSMLEVADESENSGHGSNSENPSGTGPPRAKLSRKRKVACNAGKGTAIRCHGRQELAKKTMGQRKRISCGETLSQDGANLL